MMKIGRVGLGALVALLIAAPVQAQSPLYVGVKAGLMNAKAQFHDDALNVGGLVGYKVFDIPEGDGSIEAEGTITPVDADMETGGDWDIVSLGIYFAFRTAGDVYFKGKGGFVNQNIGGTAAVPDGSDLSVGIGFGFRPSRKVGLEFEYTTLDDVKFISLGYFSHF